MKKMRRTAYRVGSYAKKTKWYVWLGLAIAGVVVACLVKPEWKDKLMSMNPFKKA